MNNKYKNNSTYYDGKHYHSKFEAEIAMELDLLKRAGELKEVQSQHKFRLSVNGKHITTYICDFKVITDNDIVRYIEAKGMLTELARVKMKILEANLPEEEPDAEFWIYWYSGKRERKV